MTEKEAVILAENVKNKFNEKDRFCKHSGIALTVVRDGYAEAEMMIAEITLNGLDHVQGGAIFTLADFAFAGAANAGGKNCVAMNSSIHFLRPGTGRKLRAIAERVNSSRMTCLVEISVLNDAGKLVAKVVTSGCYVPETSEK